MSEELTHEKLAQKAKKLENRGTGRKPSETEKFVSFQNALIKAQKQFIQEGDQNQIFEGFLSALLEYTNSEFGFIGEVYYEADGTPYQLSRAISNISLDGHTRKYDVENWRDGISFESSDTLSGIVMKAGQVVISNDVANDPRSKGIPEGHPAISCFLGVPIYQKDRLIGSFGLANRPVGYDYELVGELQPFVSACSVIISAIKLGSDLKQAEGALQESKERYGKHFQQFPVPIFVWKYQDDKFVLTGFNEATERIADCQLSEIVGITADQLYDDEDSSHLCETLFKCYHQKLTIRKEFKYRLKTTGQTKWISGTWVFIEPDTVMLHAEDINIRKHTEKALRNEILHREDEAQKLAQILMGNPIPTFVIDANSKIIHWNKACEILTNIPASDMIGTEKHRDAFYAERRELMADLIVKNASPNELAKRYGNKFSTSGLVSEGFQGEDFFPKLGENGKWLFFTAAPLKDKEGRVIGAIETIQDITDRRIAEQELRASESRYHQLFESANDAIFILKDGIVVDCNQIASEMFNSNRKAMIGLSPLDLSPETQIGREFSKDVIIKKQAIALKDVPQFFEWRFIRKNGSQFDAEVSLTRFMILDSPHGIAIVRDITERKTMIHALQERQRELDEKSSYLEKVNQALKASLDHREIEKRSVEENMFIKLKRFVFPYLEELGGCKISADAKAYVNIINTNLNDIVSHYSKTVFAKYMNLTPTEIRIADFIRDGKNSKAIAQLLGLSPSSVQWHRKNIREKLGLKNKKVNLYTYLASLDD